MTDYISQGVSRRGKARDFNLSLACLAVPDESVAPARRRSCSEINVVRALRRSRFRIACGADFDSTGASLETNAFASTTRFWKSRISEAKRSETAPALVSFAEAERISHWSKTASAKPASNQNPDLFGLSVTFRPSTVDDKVGLARPKSKTAC